LEGLELFEGLGEFAGEAVFVEAEFGEGFDLGLGGEGIVGEDFVFEGLAAKEAPAEVGEVGSELVFEEVGGLVLADEALAEGFEGGGVFVGEDGGSGEESVFEGVLGWGRHWGSLLCSCRLYGGWGFVKRGWVGDLLSWKEIEVGDW
jgi:hypothetical protein